MGATIRRILMTNVSITPIIFGKDAPSRDIVHDEYGVARTLLLFAWSTDDTVLGNGYSISNY